MMQHTEVIRFENVSKQFREGLRARRVQAVTDLSLTIFEGEVFGFLGPNGAGKSTTIKLLINLITPDSGRISILGRDVREKETRLHVGFLPENPYFYDHLTAEELLWFGGRVAGLDRQIIRDRSADLLSRVGLSEAARRPLRTYSKGMVQRAGLALALVHDPKVVILDEPMSGLDPIGRKMVVDLIIDLKREGKTVFFSSHILNDVERLCDRVGIVVKGSLRRVEPLANLLLEGDLEQIFLREVDAAAIGVPL